MTDYETEDNYKENNNEKTSCVPVQYNGLYFCTRQTGLNLSAVRLKTSPLLKITSSNPGGTLPQRDPIGVLSYMV